MIIIDFQQIMLANLAKQMGNADGNQLDESILRHMVLNSLRAIRMKFRDRNDDVVIACDSRNNWRKEFYPYYKANRAKKRNESPIDWEKVFVHFGTLRQELKEFFPYRVIEVDRAEGDDVIGTLVHRFGSNDIMGFDIEKITIVSGDHDYKQLQKYANVEQWDHVNKRVLTCNNPDRYLAEQILRGDVGDGVPNFLSDDDTLVTPGKRQVPMFEKNMDSYLANYPDNPASPTLLRNWHRNRTMVDLTFVPQDIQDAVNQEYELQAGKTRRHLTNYFIKKGLKNLHAYINDF